MAINLINILIFLLYTENIIKYAYIEDTRI